MIMKNFTKPFVSVSLLISMGVVLTPNFSVRAESVLSEGMQISMAFEPPPGEGMPERTAGGGSRGQCPTATQAANPPLMALVPTFSQPSQDANRPKSLEMKGLTVAATPMFFFYVPALPATEAAFSLKDENNNDIYQTDLSLPQQPGIVAVKLPENTPPLEVGKTYRWSFGVMCQAQTSQARSEVVFISGEIRRIEPDIALKNQLKTATPLEQAEIYAENGIWFETLTTLAQLRQNKPNDEQLKNQWTQLLQSVGLEEIANQSFVDSNWN